MKSYRRIWQIIIAFALIMANGEWLTANGQKVICHRGFWDTPGSAQNSIAALVKADSIGAYGSEFDVWMTADGELVVNHDKVYKGFNMETSTFEQVRTIHLDNGEKLPTLDEYLTKGKELKIRLVLEMKSLSDFNREDECVAKIVRKLKHYDLLDRTDIIAFSINACLAFKKLLPDTKIYYLDNDYTPCKLKSLGFAGLDYEQNVMKQHSAWTQEAHDLGLEVNVWTVNDNEALQYFINQGVDYITTNKPVELQNLLKKK
ncbi:MAG: glycerophosphodiester phosphodiesterase [Bacteroidaceae bacterium]|nr:glycerophosphodiester phosphodiesterase [Bacteroidaceae bacterium]